MYRHLFKDSKGYAVVEATILFPIIMMIFAGLVLLSMYLPTRMALQRATQYAATALATEQSDTWLDYDTGSMKYRLLSREQLPNVYAALIASFFSQDTKYDAKKIVETVEGNGITNLSGDLDITCEVINYIVYKEIKVTATRIFRKVSNRDPNHSIVLCGCR